MPEIPLETNATIYPYFHGYWSAYCFTRDCTLHNNECSANSKGSYKDGADPQGHTKLASQDITINYCSGVQPTLIFTNSGKAFCSAKKLPPPDKN
jgi:hypothetical protein